MDKDFKSGLKFALGIFVFFAFIFGVFAVGFHIADEVLPGKFTGNYSFNGTLNLTETTVVGFSSGDIIPSGAVMAFNLTICPIGWSPADGTSGNPDLRGEFIRGLDDGRGIDSGRVLASWQNFQSTPYDEIKINSNSYGSFIGGPLNGITAAPSVDTASYTIDRVEKNYRDEFETRPRNIALLYCVKD